MITHNNDNSKDDFIKELKSFIESKFNEYAKNKANCVFRISNIVNHDHYDANDECDKKLINELQREIRDMSCYMFVYREIMSKLV